MGNFDYYILGFKKYAEFEGRANRREFWFFLLFHLLITAFIDILDGSGRDDSLILQAYNLLLILPLVAISIRRLHDIGKSGWFCLIPIYNLFLYARESQKGANQYGAESKAK